MSPGPAILLMQQAEDLQIRSALVSRAARDYYALYGSAWSDYEQAIYHQRRAEERAARARMAYDSALELGRSCV